MLGWKYSTLGAFLGAGMEKTLPLDPTPFVTGSLGASHCPVRAGQGPLVPIHGMSSILFCAGGLWGQLSDRGSQDGEYLDRGGSSY